MAQKRCVVDMTLALLAFAGVPALWPLAFLAVAAWQPDAIDPLLGGLQNILYVPGLLWLGLSVVVTFAVTHVFRLRRTNILYLIVSAALAAGLLTCLYLWDFIGVDIANRSRPAGSPRDVPWDYLLTQWGLGVGFGVAVALVTGVAFVAIGGLKFWKQTQAKVGD